MKLVDILARDLSAWPEGFDVIQGYRWAYFSFKKYEQTPWFNEAVTRAEWQAAVDALKAGSAPAWVGLGLPPIGIDVEVLADYSHPRFDRFIGQQVHIVAHDVINGDPVSVFRMPVDGDDTEQDYHAMVAGSFRPIRTPEQIAAEELGRIEAWLDSNIEELGSVAAKLHASGFRVTD
jgi:hypothetical protein